MKKIVVYVEGGGCTAAQQAELRTGFDELFRKQKEAAKKERISLRFVLEGGRDATFNKFNNEALQSQPDQCCVLLVDSEGPIPAETVAKDKSEDEIAKADEANAKTRVEHLKKRDPWSFKGIEPLHVHLMAQCMETWLLADPEKLEEFYGQGFRRNALPQRSNLEEEEKLSVYKKIAAATKDTKKKEYSEQNHAKITHASKLLQQIRPERISERCPRFKTFVAWLDNEIETSDKKKQP